MKYFILSTIVVQLLFMGCGSGGNSNKVLPSVKENPKPKENSNQSGQIQAGVQEEQDQSQVNDKQEELIKDEEAKSTEDQNDTQIKEDEKENEIQESLLEDIKG